MNRRGSFPGSPAQIQDRLATVCVPCRREGLLGRSHFKCRKETAGLRKVNFKGGKNPMKKFLSLVLALVMAMSLVTISAGAKDFTYDSKVA